VTAMRDPAAVSLPRGRVLSRPGYLEQFRRRVIQDAISEALPGYWQRRAAAFAAVGTPSADGTADACRRHAEFLTANPVDLDEAIAAELEAVVR